jgi:hydroxypyruvate reductase
MSTLKPEIVQMGPVAPQGQALLDAGYTIHRYWQAADKDAFIASIKDRIQVGVTSGQNGFNGAMMDRFPQLKRICNFGVGYDGVDANAAAARNIIVTNTPDVLNECVADTCLALILATVRRIAFHDRYVRAGKWLEKAAPLTDRLWGSKMGILGLGRIGMVIARRAEGFKLDISYCNRNRRTDVPYAYYPSALELAKNVKILVVVTPGGKATDKIINKEVIDALGPTGYLINISRGSTVDEDYLLDALRNNRLGGAGLDVFVHEPKVPEGFFGLDNVTLFPHIGSGTQATRQAMGQLLADNVAAFFAGKPPLTPVAETPSP